MWFVIIGSKKVVLDVNEINYLYQFTAYILT